MTTTTAQPQTQQPATTDAALDPAMFPTTIDVNTLKTPTGKTVQDLKFQNLVRARSAID